MIKKLNEKYKKSLLDYLLKEPEFNLFIIGDVLNFGFDKNFQEIWACFDNNNEYQAVLLIYYNNYIFYTHKSTKNEFNSVDSNFIKFLKKINENIHTNKIECLSMKKEIFDGIRPYLNVLNENSIYYERTGYFLKCKEINPEVLIQHTNKVQYATVDDVEDIHKLLDKIKEFNLPRNIESTKNSIKTKAGKIVYIRDDSTNEIIATAATTAENPYSAMIVGVGTHPDYRKKGYASVCMYVLTKDLIDAGKTACLFFDNPDAGKIYQRLGFNHIGMWTMIPKHI